MGEGGYFLHRQCVASTGVAGVVPGLQPRDSTVLSRDAAQRIMLDEIHA